MSNAQADASAVFARYLVENPSRHHFVRVDEGALVSAIPTQTPHDHDYQWDPIRGDWCRKHPFAPVVLESQIFQHLLDLRNQLHSVGRGTGIKELWKWSHINYAGINRADVRKFCSLWSEHHLQYNLMWTSSRPTLATVASSASAASAVLPSSPAASAAPSCAGLTTSPTTVAPTTSPTTVTFRAAPTIAPTIVTSPGLPPSSPECVAATAESSQALDRLLVQMGDTVKSNGKRRLRIPIRNMKYWTPMMTEARLARTFTTTDSVLGKGTANYEEADVLFLTEEEARVEMLRDPHIYWKPIVVCAAPKEGQHTIETFFDYLDTWSETVHVQAQGTDGTTEEWPVERVRQHFSSPWQDRDPLPLNCLDLRSHERYVPIWLQDPRFNLLDDVYDHMQAASRNGGKAKRQKTIPAEMYMCQRLKLLAQRGAVSLPHHDHHGSSRWAMVLEGKKVWTMWGREDDEGFRKAPTSYNGPDKFYVILEKGQTLIMRRSLTFHSPGTLEDCLMDSGCYLQYNNIIASMRATVFELRNSNTIDGAPAEQLLPLVKVLKSWIKDGKRVKLFDGETDLNCFADLYIEIIELLKNY